MDLKLKPGDFHMKTTHKSEVEVDLFREELTQMINLNHSLCKLAEAIDWKSAEEIAGSWFCEDNGRPSKDLRLIAGLFFLKQLKDVSDEDLPALWVENPYWQYFCGETYFQHEFPIHPTSMGKWRKKMSEADAEKLLALTIEVGIKTQTVKKSDLNKVNADTTVQEKAIAFPTDAKLYAKAIELLGKFAKAHGIKVKQSYKFVSHKQLFKGSNYCRANQYKRAKKETKKLKTNLGRLLRDIQRKVADNNELTQSFKSLSSIVEKLLSQQKDSKNKIYSLHALEVECIAKGKARKRYEFGVKVSIVSTQASNFILGTQALHGNPYDGHTLVGALNQVERLCGVRPCHSFVDNGYKGHEEKQTDVHVARKKSTYATRYLKRQMRRRNAIEALISHSKRDGQLKRNYLKGQHGDKLNALLSEVGYNLPLILAKLKLFLLQILALLFGDMRAGFLDSLIIQGWSRVFLG